MICFDAHVHLPEIRFADTMLASAKDNFTRNLPKECENSEPPFILFLTEARGCDYFSIFREKAEGSGYISQGGWRFTLTAERESLLATRDDWPGGRLFLLAGRQVVTAEKIEVLALATGAEICEGASLNETVETVKAREGLAVLPWGVGKWLGKRGKILDGFLRMTAPDGVFVGDNGGRPSFWPAPRLFRTAAGRGIRLLPGSDPLPLPGEEKRVGSYGGLLQGDVTDDHPAADLRRLLTDMSHPIVPFGKQPGALQFFRTQMALRGLSLAKK